MTDIWLRIVRAFWISQAYLAQQCGDERGARMALDQANKIEWKLKWRIEI